MSCCICTTSSDMLLQHGLLYTGRVATSVVDLRENQSRSERQETRDERQGDIDERRENGEELGDERQGNGEALVDVRDPNQVCNDNGYDVLM